MSRYLLAATWLTSHTWHQREQLILILNTLKRELRFYSATRKNTPHQLHKKVIRATQIKMVRCRWQATATAEVPGRVLLLLYTDPQCLSAPANVQELDNIDRDSRSYGLETELGRGKIPTTASYTTYGTNHYASIEMTRTWLKDATKKRLTIREIKKSIHLPAMRTKQLLVGDERNQPSLSSSAFLFFAQM